MPFWSNVFSNCDSCLQPRSRTDWWPSKVLSTILQSNVFMPQHRMLQRRHYVFVCSLRLLSVSSSVPCQIFLSLRKNTEQISMKFAESNHFHAQIKWLYSGRNWNRNKGAGYDRIFETIGFAAMSNRCWRLANEFKRYTAQTKADVISDIFHVTLKIWTTLFTRHLVEIVSSRKHLQFSC